MNINLYNFSKRTNSLKVPASSSGQGLSVRLKETTSLFNPTFILNTNPSSYNYVSYGNYYYYINDIRYIHNDVYEVDCVIDVLATYRSQILNTSAFVQYSSSKFNDGIIDTRLSTQDTVAYHINSALLLTNGATGRSGTYILSFATSQPNLGPSGCVWVDGGTAMRIAEALNSQGFNDFLKEFDKQFNGAYDSLLSCRYVPFNWTGDSQQSRNIVLGGYNTGETGYIPSKQVGYSCSINIPWQFSDFRNLQPFTSLLLYLPAYGFLELNPNDFIGQSSINIQLIVDGVTGEGTYVIGNVSRVTCMFSNEISVGTSKNSMLGGISSIINSGVSIAEGNYANAIGDIIGIVNSQKRQIGNTGSLGGGSSVLTTLYSRDWKNVHLIAITHNTNVAPSNLASRQGRPLMEVISLSDLTGYCQCINASVAVNASQSIIDQINSYLNGGVYIE